MSTTRVPKGLLVPVILAVAFLCAPLLGLLARIPWERALHVLGDEAVLDALLLSLWSATAASGIAFCLGLPLAVWLAAGHDRRRTVTRVLVLMPMVLPPVVVGVALLFAYGNSGVFGPLLDAWLGAPLPFHTAGVVLAQSYVALPFLVLAIEAGLRALDPGPAEAAATLGAGPWRVLTTVTLPSIAPALGTGALLAWARALGEFGATITFAGNLAGETRTLPLAVFTTLETDPPAALVLGFVLILCSATVLFVLRRQWFPQR